MATFTYTAKNKEGTIKKGDVESESRETVVALLEEQSLVPITISKKGGINFNIKKLAIGHVPLVEKMMFTRQLSTMINAGLPLTQSLHILEKQTSNVKMQKVITDITKDVEGGLSLSTALEKNPKVFSKIYVSMVKSGEVGGMMDEILDRLADQLEKDHTLFSKIRSALTYPAVIILAMFGAVTYLISSVVPKIGEMFEELDAPLPTSTRFLLFISKLFSDYIVFTLIFSAISVYGFLFFLKRSEKLRFVIHKILLHIPIFGKMAKKTNVARFTRTFGTLLASGIPVLDTLNVISDSISNLVYKKEIDKMAQDIKNGVNVSDSLKKAKSFPPIVSEMVAVGEETGTLDSILIKVSNFYEKEIDNMVNNLTSLLEPLILILIGVGVGFIVISIITPIYQLTNLI